MTYRILYIDPDCPAAYTDRSLLEKPMGGTEATIIRVTEGLSRLGHQVIVAQGARRQPEVSSAGVQYCPFSLNRLEELPQAPDAVVVLNSPKLLRKIRKAYPQAGLYLWMHCFPGKRRRKMINKFTIEAKTEIITVSDTLKEHIKTCLNRYPDYGRHSHTGGQFAHVRTIFNPVDDRLQPNNKSVDQYKLVFFSSPHKGLEQVLEAFVEVRKRWPAMRLCLANPGYWPFPKNFSEEAVEILGSLTHAEVIEHVREAFCVFYPQNRFKETFGLVFAEANAVGTPVITHPLGASAEVLTDQQQLVDVTDVRNVVKLLQQWMDNGRPEVRLHERFRLREVLAGWEALLQKIDSRLQKVKFRQNGRQQNSNDRSAGSGITCQDVARRKSRANDPGKPERYTGR